VSDGFATTDGPERDTSIPSLQRRGKLVRGREARDSQDGRNSRGESLIDVLNKDLKVDGGAKWDTDHKREFGVPVFLVGGVHPEEGELIWGSLKSAMAQSQNSIGVENEVGGRVSARSGVRVVV